MTAVKNGERLCVPLQINSSRNKQNKINCRSHCSFEFPWPVSYKLQQFRYDSITLHLRKRNYILRQKKERVLQNSVGIPCRSSEMFLQPAFGRCCPLLLPFDDGGALLMCLDCDM